MAEQQKDHRVQFDFTPEALQRLDELKQKSGASTRAETVRMALRAFEWLIEELDPNGTVKLFDKSDHEIAKLKVKLLLK